MLGENCSAGCLTRDHESFGACMRSKSLRVAYCQSWKGLDATRQKTWDKDLENYRGALSQGIEPKTTWKADVDKAVRISDATGEAFKAR